MTTTGPSESDGGELRTGTTKSGKELSKTDIFEILSAERRQEVLRYLHREEGTADIGELAECIASIECNCSVQELDSQQRKRTYVGLYQCHLPKMAEAGVVDYNSDRGEVSLNERSQRLLNYIYLEEQEMAHTEDEFGDTVNENQGFIDKFLR